MRVIECFGQRKRDAQVLRGEGDLAWRKQLVVSLVLACATGIAQAQAHDQDAAFLPSPVRSVSTVPANGEVNPYGVAFVPDRFEAGAGPLKSGDILVSNFNNSKNLQGTGTTIVRIGKSGPATTFFQGTAPLGLSTALGVLISAHSNYVRRGGQTAESSGQSPSFVAR